jgi:hypothetical protein
MKARNMKQIIYKGKTYEIPKPFDECFFGKEPTKEIQIGNRFNDKNHQQYAMLPAFAVAIYDTIIGAERIQDYTLMQKGSDWFSRNFTKQYYTLLD